ncbi:MAG: hypothetical protein LQ340_004592 [Diploschistes diacapsis]|nr:MAG: hypothetical protein LQ340_004592 [Diploschistes diacapsis]
MCNLEQWTLVDANGNRHPREQLYTCNRRAAANADCGHVQVYTLNDEIMPRAAPVVTTIHTAPNPPLPRKRAKRDGLRLVFQLGNDNQEKPRPTPPTPQTPNIVLSPPFVNLRQPLDPAAIAAITPPSQPHLPPQPPVTGPAWRPIQQQQPRPNIIRISPPHGSPSRPPRRRYDIVIAEPVRDHTRRSSVERCPHSSNRNERHHSTHRDHDHRRDDGRRDPPASPRRGNNHKRERTPSPVRRRRAEAELANTRREAEIQAEMDRLRAEMNRRHREREQARRTSQREEELRRLDTEIERLRQLVARQQRAWRNVRPVVHQFHDGHDSFDDDDGGGGRAGHRGGPRERSSSSSRGRGRRVVFNLRVHVRRLSRSADRGSRRQSYIEDRPRGRDEEFPLPARRERCVSALRHGWLPRRNPRERAHDDDDDDDEQGEREEGRGWRPGWL